MNTCPQHVPFEDLLQAGMVGLIDALNKFDSAKNVKFASYAKFRIRGAILDSLRECDWSPRDLRRKSRQIDTTMQKLQTELGTQGLGAGDGQSAGAVAGRVPGVDRTRFAGWRSAACSASRPTMDRKQTWHRTSQGHRMKIRLRSA